MLQEIYASLIEVLESLRVAAAICLCNIAVVPSDLLLIEVELVEAPAVLIHLPLLALLLVPGLIEAATINFLSFLTDDGARFYCLHLSVM